MSKDIRSYFTSSKTLKVGASTSSTKAKKRPVISSDEDEVKVNSPIKRHKRNSKKHILSDSEDELAVTKKKTGVSKMLRVKEDEEKPKTIVSPSDIFGSTPIKRIEAPNVTEKLQKLEAEFHCDDDFEATLNQLDTSQVEEAYLGGTDRESKNNSRYSDKNKSVEVATSSRKWKSDKEECTPDEKRHSTEKEYLHDRQKGKTSDAIKKIEKESRDDEKVNRAKLEYKQKRKKQSKGSSIGDEDFKVLPLRTAETSQRKSSRSSNEEKSRKGECESDVTVTVNKNLKSKKSKGVSQIQIEKKFHKEKVHERDEALDPYEEIIKKKKERAALYQQYLHRGGARNSGCKEIPAGAEYCLAGLSFVITGVLESLEREEAEDLINKYSGRVVHQVSKKVDYVVLGDQPGPSKLEKADTLGIKKISEDDLLELIRTRPTGKVGNVRQSHARTKKREEALPESEPINLSPKKDEMQVEEVIGSEEKMQTQIGSKTKIMESTKENGPATSVADLQKKNDKPVQTTIVGSEMQALVERYRPTTMKQIIGQQGNKSNATKLYTWLQNWKKNQCGDVKRAKPSPWAKSDDGAFFKAALLSGPPGVGKTTTVQVVCNELGMDHLEFNASDTRSKKLLKERVAELLSNTTMKGYFVGDHKERPASNHVLVMDEVDGMAGNEDRGGLQELINLIKSTDVPIICICNDRNNPKMRTLANYTFDLQFQKPRLEQIRAAMMSMCYKENIKITKEDLNNLIQGTNQDIRQVINQLAMLVDNPYCADKIESKRLSKDVRLGPWNVIRKVFSAAEHKNMSIRDKSDLFFHDYNIAPLFVQENYLSVVPDAPKSELLERVALAAESLALGDVVEKSIRSNGSWSLLPMQACYSSVIPGTVMSGHITSQISFPSWLGRNSKQGKFNRLLQEITVHARLATAASKEAINLDYLSRLRDAIVRPLAINNTEGVNEALRVMNHYHLMREDLDSIVEISLWPGQRDPMQAIESKVKAAFTRAYNKSSIIAPYAIDGRATKKKAQASQDEGFIEGEEKEEEEEEEEEENNSAEENDNVDSDRMIKVKKPATDKKTASTGKREAKPGKRGKGRGKVK